MIFYVLSFSLSYFGLVKLLFEIRVGGQRDQ